MEVGCLFFYYGFLIELVIDSVISSVNSLRVGKLHQSHTLEIGVNKIVNPEFTKLATGVLIALSSLFNGFMNNLYFSINATTSLYIRGTPSK